MEENKYEEALERAKSAIKECGDNLGRIKMIESIFPELAEPKEENIRKCILMMFKNAVPDIFNRYGMNKDDAIAYLEKLKDFDKKLEQAYKNGDGVFFKKGYDTGYVEGTAAARLDLEKQSTIKDGNSIDQHFWKPITTTETKTPKFKVGDWITYTDDEETLSTKKIVKFYGNKVKLVDTNGIYVVFPKSELKHYRLWSIADAQNGDVLEFNCGIGIFICFDESGYNAYCHCYYTFADIFEVDKNELCDIYGAKPALKEQREQLFERMTKEGYIWNPITKELSQISVTKKSDKVWSEDDEIILNGIIDDFGDGKTSSMLQESWLKSIKDRIQPQQRQDSKWKWDEDDEKFFREDILIGLGNADNVSPELYSKIIDWINLIKKRLS